MNKIVSNKIYMLIWDERKGLWIYLIGLMGSVKIDVIFVCWMFGVSKYSGKLKDVNTLMLK